MGTELSKIRRAGGALMAAMSVVTTMAVAQLSAWSSPDPSRIVTFEGVNNTDDGVVVDRIYDQLAVGADGSIYSMVISGGSVTVGPGTETATIGAASPGYSTVLTKTNTNGELEWQRNWSFTTNEYFLGTTITVVGTRVLVAGNVSTALAVDLDPTAGVSSYTGIGYDSAVVELDTSGNFVDSAVFEAQFGSSFVIQRLQIIDDGDVIAFGQFDGVATLPGGGTVTTLSSSALTAIIARVDFAANTTTWVATLDGSAGSGGRTGNVTVAEVDFATDGSAWVVGSFQSTNVIATNADATTSATLVNSNPTTPVANVFIARIDQAGQFSWVAAHDAGPSTGVFPVAVEALRGGGSLVAMSERTMVTVTDGGVVTTLARPDYSVRGISQTADGKIRLVGSVAGPSAVDLDFGPGIVNVTGDVDEDAYVLTLNEDYSYLGVHMIAATGRQRAVFVSDHPDGGFVVVGLGEANVTEFSNTVHSGIYTPSVGKDLVMFIIHYDAAGTTGTTTTTTTTTIAPTGAPASGRYVTGNKRVTLRWSPVDGAASYVVSTAAGTTRCETVETSCQIRRLRNGKLYTYHVRSVNSAGVASTDSRSIRVIPGFKLRTTTHKVRRSPKLTSIVTTASRGTKSWSVRSGSCRISAGRLIMPTRSGTCRLRLSVAKRGSYPAMSTTVRVTVTR